MKYIGTIFIILYFVGITGCIIFLICKMIRDKIIEESVWFGGILIGVLCCGLIGVIITCYWK